MRYRTLGRTNLQLSEVAFGVWTVSTGWWGQIEEADAIKLLQQAHDIGINLFDTADTYGNGYGEEILGKALKKQRPDIVIATKFGYDFYSTPTRKGHQERPQNFDPKFVRYACEQSLRRLQTDYIDLYQLHNCRIDAIRRDDLFHLLEVLVQEGKIRHYGVALGPDIGWFEEGEASMREQKVASLQIIYSILEQDPARKFFPIAQETQTGLLARVPHASEILTDKFLEQPTFSANDHRSHRKQEWLRQAMAKRESVKFLAVEGITLAQAAIAFSLAQETVTSTLPNITSLEELKEYASASDCPGLSPKDLERIEDLYQHNFYLEPAPSPS